MFRRLLKSRTRTDPRLTLTGVVLHVSRTDHSVPRTVADAWRPRVRNCPRALPQSRRLLAAARPWPFAGPEHLSIRPVILRSVSGREPAVWVTVKAPS